MIIEHLAQELRDSLAIEKSKKLKRTANTKYFSDEHFRLGFEDFPVSYPIVFDEFLFSKEMFEEYFSMKISFLLRLPCLRGKNPSKYQDPY
jgi:hypothetical protein